MHSFLSLVDRLNAATAAERADIESRIWEAFGVSRAVLVLDMSQFSLTVRRDGILPYLGLIRRMHLLTAPIVAAHGGRVVKYVADNLFAIFEEPAQAAAAAVRMNLAAEEAGEAFTVAVGIDYGRFLLIPEVDVWGDAINVACKLGEDLARPGEVLLTEAARARLPGDFPWPLAPQKVSVAGLDLVAHGVVYR